MNIENIYINQDTEYAVEEILTYAKDYGYTGNFATAKKEDKEYLPEGDILNFLYKVTEIALDILSQTKNPRIKWRVLNDIKKVQNLFFDQEDHFNETGTFIKYPASMYSILSDHLKG